MRVSADQAMTLPKIAIYDDFLAKADHRAVWELLKQPGWAYGAYSDGGADAHRYFYKHFAGYFDSGQEKRSASGNEEDLKRSAPLLFNFWLALKKGPMAGLELARCYANGMPAGTEGGVHADSNIDTHLTAIYYPHLDWHASFGGETLLFNPSATDVIAAIYPKPNRLAVFAGTIPHVARPTSRRCADLRITLMFKTMPANEDLGGPDSKKIE